MSKRLRVGMCATIGLRCGIADYTRQLVAALAGEADVETVPIRPACSNPLWAIAAGLRLNRKDIAHLQHTYSFFGVDPLTYTLVVRTLYASLRTPFVLTAHTVRGPGPARFDGRWGSRLANAVGAPAWLDLETFRRADVIIVHSAFHKERLTERGLPPGRIHVIPPGIPPRVAVTPSEVQDFRDRWGIPEGRPVIGTFGFLESSKRYQDLMDAIAQLPEEPVLLVAGGPRLPVHEGVREQLRQAAEQLGLGGRLIVTGYLEPASVPIVLEAMEIVVVPYATDDSMSYSLHRALGQWRPIVATDLPAIREVQARSACLAPVPPADPSALRDALGRLLSDPVARERLSAAAHAYAVKEGMAAAAARTLHAYASAQEGYRCEQVS